MIKAVFLDFDSTTFSHVTKKIPDSAYRAILNAQANNIKIFLSTGRDYNELATFDCRNIKFDGYVLVNGQLILDKELNILEVFYMEGKERETIKDLYNNKKYPIAVRNLDDAYINYIDEKTIETFKSVDSVLPPINEKLCDNILIASIYIKDDKEKQEVLNTFKDSNVTWWHKDSCDIVPKEASKMRGINKVLEIYDISKDETLTVGDGENDIEMIKNIPHSVAMGNAVPIIKNAAEYITDDIDNDGLEKAFKKYKLIV